MEVVTIHWNEPKSLYTINIDTPSISSLRKRSWFAPMPTPAAPSTPTWPNPWSWWNPPAPVSQPAAVATTKSADNATNFDISDFTMDSLYSDDELVKMGYVLMTSSSKINQFYTSIVDSAWFDGLQEYSTDVYKIGKGSFKASYNFNGGLNLINCSAFWSSY